MSHGLGSTQQKIILLLLGGLTLGFSGSPNHYFRNLKLIGQEWKKINRDSLRRSIQTLYKSKLVKEKHHQDGSLTLVLSDEGRERALRYKLGEMKIKRPLKWDGKWHLVTFDIPESKKKARDALRQHLNRIGLIEFQKSIFISPYPCNDEIDFLVELFQINSYVRKITAHYLDNAEHLKLKFKLA